MNREIKFRGRRIDNGEWIYGSLLDGDIIVAGPVDADGDYIGVGEWSSVDKDTVGQYTGLKDKNGKEIYEGSILANERGDKFSIHYFAPDCRFMSTLVESYGNEDRYEVDEYLDPWVYLEVIGNIHDNTEPLKGEENA